MTESIVRSVTTRALVKRINRKLAHDGELLRRARGERWVSSVGHYYIVNERNVITASHVDPEQLGREFGCLERHETIVE